MYLKPRGLSVSQKTHTYNVVVEWTGNTGTGTSGYRAYDRSHTIAVPSGAKPSIPGSSDPSFRGDGARWNPEELFLGALSACHKLFYLHLCADAGVIVTQYVDRAEGEMLEEESGAGRFTRVVLRPEVMIASGSDVAKAMSLHASAHAHCFLANSVNFPVEHDPHVHVEQT